MGYLLFYVAIIFLIFVNMPLSNNPLNNMLDITVIAVSSQSPGLILFFMFYKESQPNITFIVFIAVFVVNLVMVGLLRVYLIHSRNKRIKRSATAKGNA